jgi:hypothetical protein
VFYILENILLNIGVWGYRENEVSNCPFSGNDDKKKKERSGSGNSDRFAWEKDFCINENKLVKKRNY